jgi:hypothetical protein
MPRSRVRALTTHALRLLADCFNARPSDPCRTEEDAVNFDLAKWSILPKAGRKLRKGGAVGVVLLLCCQVVTSCSWLGSKESRPLDTSVFNIKAFAKIDIDEKTGGITLPFDRYLISDAEDALIGKARALVLHSCLTEGGADIKITVRTAAEPEPSRRYGVWTEAQAATYGYSLPQHRSLVSIGNAPPDAISTCRRSPAYGELIVHYPDIQNAAFDTYVTVKDSAAGQKAISQWRDCLVTKGLRPRTQGDSPFLPMGATLKVTSANKRIALADVNCKQVTDLVRRLAVLEAAEQSNQIERDPQLRQLMISQRHDVEATLRRAKKVVASWQGS